MTSIKDYLKVAGAWAMNPDNNPIMLLAVLTICAACVALSFLFVSLGIHA